MKRIITRLLFPIIGFMSLLWFLFRVIPKPSRATYPCMKATAPIAFSFIVWLTGLFSSVLFFKKAKKYLAKSRYFLFSIASLASIILFLIPIMHDTKPVSAVSLFTLEDPNTPIGEGKGIYPGRVVWIYNPDVTDETFSNTQGDYWYQDGNADQTIVNQMVSEGLQKLTGETSDAAAWDAIFRYYNTNHGKGDVVYTAGEKIVIKANFNGLGNIWTSTPPQNVNTSPQICYAILDQLVNVAGISEADIHIGDPNVSMDSNTYNKCHSAFPNVIYWGNGPGLKSPVRSGSKVFFVSNGEFSNYLPQSYLDAAYLINLPVFKKHHRAGISLSSKNHFGSIAPFTNGAWHLHPSLVSPEAFHEATNGNYSVYRCFVDIMGHKDLGGKTILHLVDGIWGSTNWGHPPVKWRMPPFNNDYPSSLFLSQDPVAIESVCFDFLYTEFDETHPTEGEFVGDDKGPYPRWPGVDDYLHQAADPNKWPADINYDPENDGSVLTTMGTHEHWNNSDEKKYTRNLGTGTGIELVTNIATGIEDSNKDQAGIATDFVLGQNYPNPFNPDTEIQYTLATPAYISLALFQINGQQICELYSGYQGVGVHIQKWDGLLENGLSAASGVYMVKILVQNSSGLFQQTRKMVLNR